MLWPSLGVNMCIGPAGFARYCSHGLFQPHWLLHSAFSSSKIFEPWRKKKRCDEDIQFKAGYSEVSDSVDIVHLWVLAFVSMVELYLRWKLLYWWLNKTLTYGYSRIRSYDIDTSFSPVKLIMTFSKVHDLSNLRFLITCAVSAMGSISYIILQYQSVVDNFHNVCDIIVLEYHVRKSVSSVQTFWTLIRRGEGSS